MSRFRRYSNLIACRLLLVLILLMLAAVTACKISPPQPAQPEALTEEQMKDLNEQKDYELSLLYQELKQNIAEVEITATRLGNYGWSRFGVYLIGGIPMVDYLPSSADVEPIEDQIAAIKGTMHSIWKQRPYLETQSAVGRAEKLTPGEWKNLSTTLKNDLIAIKDNVRQYKTDATGRIDKICNFIKNSNLAHELYSDLVECRNEYLAIADSLLQALDNAIQSATAIENWEL